MINGKVFGSMVKKASDNLALVYNALTGHGETVFERQTGLSRSMAYSSPQPSTPSRIGKRGEIRVLRSATAGALAQVNEDEREGEDEED